MEKQGRLALRGKESGDDYSKNVIAMPLHFFKPSVPVELDHALSSAGFCSRRGAPYPVIASLT